MITSIYLKNHGSYASGIVKSTVAGGVQSAIIRPLIPATHV